ncbi:MAG: thiamine pyrophosphate-binding protein [Bacteroidales bacterium]
MTVAEYLAIRLSGIGVRYVFGIPGGPSIPYLEAFRAAGIEFFLTSNEAAAGIMADVTARLTGIPGVCHATFGPGATNIATGIGGALLDRSPVIVLTSEIDDKMIGRTTQMNVNHQKLFEPLTKATFRLSPGNAVDVITKAIRLCLEEYPGPVHIGLPSDIANVETNAVPPSLPSAEKIFKNDIDGIASLLDNSRNPLIAVGLTSARKGIGKELLAFLEKRLIPVVLTPMAKGIISEDHPCYAGVLFHVLSDCLEEIFERTDLVIGLGYDPVEYNYESWMPDVPLIHFDTNEMDMPESGVIVKYTGPPDEWFGILTKYFKGPLIFNSSILNSVRDEMGSVFNGFTDHFGPVTALKVLMEVLPDNVILTADVGSHLHLAGQFWKTNGRRNLIMSNGWSGMGFGIPAALAARLADQAATVVCVTGDGGFLMMAGEILTARRYNLRVIVVVLADGELNLIRLKQSWKNIAPYGTVLYSGDLFDSGSFLGVKVITADSETGMRDAVNEALLLNEPVIINARIDPEDYKWLVVRK